MIKLILLFLISFNLFAGTMPNNDYKVGKGSSTDDKGFTFNTGDGAANPTMKVNDLKTLIYSDNKVQIGDGASVNDKELIIDPASGASIKWNGSDNYVEIRNDNFRIGEGSDVDQVVEFDIGLGATNPKIKWDSTKQKFRQSIGGTDKDLGTGSGGGGGENYNNAFTADQNEGAEDGVSGWTASAGVFAASATDPLSGDQSFTWTPAAQNDTLDSPILDFEKDILMGRSCEARITYIGGDENLTMKVMDANNLVLGELNLPAHGIAGQESVFFVCPSQADITGDANKGDIRLRLENTGASASVLIKFDSSYVGTLRGLTETTLPDAFGVDISNTGVASNPYGGIITNVADGGTGILTADFVGLTVAPNCQGTTRSSGGSKVVIQAISNTSITINTYDSAGSLSERSISLACHKAGVDAKQSVQIYRAIPKTKDFSNEFSFIYDTTSDTMTSLSHAGWASCVDSGVGAASCTLDASFTEVPSCRCSAVVGNFANVSCTVQSFSATSVSFRANNDGVAIDRTLHVSCQRQGADLKEETTQPIIVGQLTNSYAETARKNIRLEACKVTNAGTPVSGNAMCDSWVDSYTDLGVGLTQLNFQTGAFGTIQPICTCSGAGNSGDCRIAATSLSSIQINTYDATTSLTDMDFNVTCVGDK